MSSTNSGCGHLNKKHLCSGSQTTATYELAVVTADNKIDNTIICFMHSYTQTQATKQQSL